MNFSRILPGLKAFALGFAADEVSAANPHVQKALAELPGDLRSEDPIGAFVKTAHDAYAAMKADPALTGKLSLTGLLGALAHAFL